LTPSVWVGAVRTVIVLPPSLCGHDPVDVRAAGVTVSSPARLTIDEPRPEVTGRIG
jgi:hypothetical protein